MSNTDARKKDIMEKTIKMIENTAKCIKFFDEILSGSRDNAEEVNEANRFYNAILPRSVNLLYDSENIFLNEFNDDDNASAIRKARLMLEEKLATLGITSHLSERSTKAIENLTKEIQATNSNIGAAAQGAAVSGALWNNIFRKIF